MSQPVKIDTRFPSLEETARMAGVPLKRVLRLQKLVAEAGPARHTPPGNMRVRRRGAKAKTQIFNR
jgi:hypothetical protein